MDGKVLRYGYVRDEKLSHHPTATSFYYALNRSPTLKKKMEELNSKKEKKSNKEKKSSSVSQIKVHVYDIPPQTTLQQMKTVLESLNLNSPDDYEILYYLQGSLVYVCLLPS